MTSWTNHELDTVGEAEELDVSSLKKEGQMGKRTTIWVVRVGDDLYVRSVRAAAGKWFQATQVKHEGRIQAGGIIKDVHFVNESDPAINDQIDAAYRAKYGHYPAEYVDPMVTPEVRLTTLKLVPR